MKGSVTYSVAPRKNPHDKEAAPKFYAQAQARGEADIRAISDRIQAMCTVTRADVMAVLVALEGAVSDCLANGEIVRLGDLGSLQVSISSEGANEPKEFNTSFITKTRILFRPGETLSHMQQELRFERVEKKGKKDEAGTQSSDPLPGTSDVQDVQS